MKAEKVLPFETLLAYAEGKFSTMEADAIETLLADDPHSQELVNGLRSIFANENLDGPALELAFAKTEQRMEKKIYLHSNFSNHLIDLNLQLRAAAAVLILVFSFSFLTAGNSDNNYNPVGTNQYGPYDLALGSKIAP